MAFEQQVQESQSLEDERNPLKHWSQRPADDDFSFAETNEHIILLQTGICELDEHIIWPLTKQLMVYAEQIHIKSSLRLPGRTMWLFCNKLTLGGPMISIDVSGADGSDGIPGADKTAQDQGQNGGSVYLYIESLGQELVLNAAINSATGKTEYTGLYIYANGGDGGLGSNTVDATKNNGQRQTGGNAGDPGQSDVLKISGTSIERDRDN